MTKHIKATAEERMKLIAPLLSPGLDKASFQRIKDQISQETGLSERTIRRYLGRYQENGFAGLSPAARTARQSHAIPEEILQEAILLRRQVPGRSVAQLIQILEWEGKAQPGQIKRSTLQEKLSERGYSSRQMKQYNQTGTATRRFVKPHRNCLWMSDVKYAIYLPIGPSSKPKQVYLVTWIDDCTRFILHSEFYASLEKAIVIDSFRQALVKHGLPDSVYFDNGSEYRNKWMQECYQYRPHSALKDNQSPVQAFQSDKRPIRYADPKEIHEAFLHREERKVDKTGCISFYGKPYEVGLQFLGMKVTVIYDPTDISVITVQGGNLPPVQAKERVIGQWVGPKPTLPEHLTKEPATESRLLKAALKKHQNRDKPMLISYKEAGEPDV